MSLRGRFTLSLAPETQNADDPLMTSSIHDVGSVEGSKSRGAEFKGGVDSAGHPLPPRVVDVTVTLYNARIKTLHNSLVLLQSYNHLQL